MSLQMPFGWVLDLKLARRWRAWAWNRPALAMAIPLFLILAVQAIVKNDSEWSTVYVATARILAAGGDIYAGRLGYLYPPFPAMLALAFVPMPDLAVRLTWYLVNVAAIFWLIRSAWTLAGGKALKGGLSENRREWLALFLGLLCFIPYGLNTLAHQQTDIVIAALLTGGCALVVSGAVPAGAALIGLAVAFKGPPLLFAAYFAFKRYWLAATLIVAVAIGVNLLPDLISRPQEGMWLGNWLSHVALPSQQLDRPIGSWNADQFNLFNQSLSGSIQRWANTRFEFSSGGLEIKLSETQIPSRLLKAFTYAIMLLMLAISVWALRRNETTVSRTHLEPPSRLAIELGMTMVLVLLFSPMSGHAHFIALALPAFCLARLAVCNGSGVARVALFVTVVAAIVVNKDLVRGNIHWLGLWSGLTTIDAIAIWFACVLFLTQRAKVVAVEL